jgi:hypothetical protein
VRIRRLNSAWWVTDCWSPVGSGAVGSDVAVEWEVRLRSLHDGFCWGGRYDSESAMKLPRFRLASAMVIIAVVAIDLAAIQVTLDRPELSLAVLGFLPMVSVLVVVKSIDGHRPESSPFVMGFELFGVVAIVLLLIVVSIPGLNRLLMSYVALPMRSLETIVGADNPFLNDQIAYFVVAIMLGWPQITLAMLGGYLSRNYDVDRR